MAVCRRPRRWHGSGVRPTQPASSRRLRNSREKISCVSGVASCAPIPFRPTGAAIVASARSALPAAAPARTAVSRLASIASTCRMTSPSGSASRAISWQSCGFPFSVSPGRARRVTARSKHAGREGCELACPPARGRGHRPVPHPTQPPPGRRARSRAERSGPGTESALQMVSRDPPSRPVAD